MDTYGVESLEHSSMEVSEQVVSSLDRAADFYEELLKTMPMTPIERIVAEEQVSRVRGLEARMQEAEGRIDLSGEDISLVKESAYIVQQLEDENDNK